MFLFNLLFPFLIFVRNGDKLIVLFNNRKGGKLKKGNFLDFFVLIHHCFVCRRSDSTVSEDAGIEHRTVSDFGIV